jgi:ABC-type Fe3+-siderophore transport system permease subunit
MLESMSKTTLKKKHRLFPERYAFLGVGMVTGFFLSYFITAFVTAELVYIYLFASIICIFFFVPMYIIFKVPTRLSRYVKIRFVFLGIAVSSFIYALYDIHNFSNHIDLVIVSFSGSIALGGIFAIIERIVDLWERKEL